MNMRGRLKLAVGLALLAGSVVWAARLNVPVLTGGLKGDEANYIVMALSLAKDADLKYLPEDYQRFRSMYGRGPDGVFLKRTDQTRSPERDGYEYGKPFIYSVFVAPFAAVMGLGGFIWFNLLLIVVSLGASIAFARARLGPVSGAVAGSAFILGSIAPVYGAWITPEVFNFSLVLIAYFLWLYKEVAPPDAWKVWRDPRLEWMAALLLGIAAYAKISNLLMIGPLAVQVLYKRQWKHAAVIAVLFAVGSAGLYGTNAWITGESNYQGGDRKYFLERFTLDGTNTFDTAGDRLATNEANDKNILAPTYLIPMLRWNLWYFFVGRDAGFIPYFFPGAIILVWWLFRWRTWTLWQVTTFVAVAGSAIGLLVFTPESWNGGGGPVGNRYYLSIYPAFLFLIPRGFHLVGAIAALVAGLACVGPILLHPFDNSRVSPPEAARAVWVNPERWPLRLFPVELTLVADSLPNRLNPLRWRVVVNKEPTVILYYMDGRTYFQEENGFWVAPGTTDIVVRTEYPLSSIELKISSNVANTVEVEIGGRSRTVTIEPEKEQTVRLSPAPGVHAFNSYQTVLTITTANGFYPRDRNPSSTDTRHLGAFITPQYRVDTSAPR